MFNCSFNLRKFASEFSEKSGCCKLIRWSRSMLLKRVIIPIFISSVVRIPYRCAEWSTLCRVNGMPCSARWWCSASKPKFRSTMTIIWLIWNIGSSRSRDMCRCTRANCFSGSVRKSRMDYHTSKKFETHQLKK